MLRGNTYCLVLKFRKFRLTSSSACSHQVGGGGRRRVLTVLCVSPLCLCHVQVCVCGVCKARVCPHCPPVQWSHVWG